MALGTCPWRLYPTQERGREKERRGRGSEDDYPVRATIQVG